MSSKSRLKDQWSNTLGRLYNAQSIDEYNDLAGQLRKLQDEWLRLYGKPLPSRMTVIPSIETLKLSQAIEPAPETEPEPAPAPEPTQQEILKENAEQAEENVRIANELIGKWNKIMEEYNRLNEQLAGTPESQRPIWIGDPTMSRSQIIALIVKTQQDLDDVKREWKDRIPGVPLPEFMTGEYPAPAPYDPNKDETNPGTILATRMEEYKEKRALLAAKMSAKIQELTVLDMTISAIDIMAGQNPGPSLMKRESVVNDIRTIKQSYRDLLDEYNVTEKDDERAPFNYKIPDAPKLTMPSVPGVPGVPIMVPSPEQAKRMGLLEIVPYDVLIAAGLMVAGAFWLSGQKSGQRSKNLRDAMEALGWSAVYLAGGVTVYIAGKELFICMDETNGNFFKAVGKCMGQFVNTLLESIIEMTDKFLSMIVGNLGELVEQLWDAIGKALKKALRSLGEGFQGILGDSGPLGGALGGGGGGGIPIISDIGDVFGF